MGAGDEQAIDLNRLMPDLWPDLEGAHEELDASSADSWLQHEDPLLTRTLPCRNSSERASEEQDTRVALTPAQVTPTLSLPAISRRQRLARRCLRIALSALIALIALFLVADTWLLLVHFMSPR